MIPLMYIGDICAYMWLVCARLQYLYQYDPYVDYDVGYIAIGNWQ